MSDSNEERSMWMFQLFILLLHFETKVRQRQQGSRIEAKISHFLVNYKI